MVLLLIVTSLSRPATADFGVQRRRDGKATIDAASGSVSGLDDDDETTGSVSGSDDDARGSVSKVDETLVRRLKEIADESLTEQMLVNIAVVIDGSKKDPETSLLLLRIKQQGDFDAFKSDLTAVEIVTGMAEPLQHIEIFDLLFENDPAKAVQEMNMQGMLSPDCVQEYMSNPQQLMEDTRKNLYFTFLSYAAAGGYL